MMIDLLLQGIQVAIEPKQQLLRVQKIDRLINMQVPRPLPTLKMLYQLIVLLFRIQMLLSLWVVLLPICQHFPLHAVQSRVDLGGNLFHIELEVSPLLLQLIPDKQSLLPELLPQFLTVHPQFQTFDVHTRVLLEVNQLVGDLLSYFLHIFLMTLIDILKAKARQVQ